MDEYGQEGILTLLQEKCAENNIKLVENSQAECNKKLPFDEELLYQLQFAALFVPDKDGNAPDTHAIDLNDIFDNETFVQYLLQDFQGHSSNDPGGSFEYFIEGNTVHYTTHVNT